MFNSNATILGTQASVAFGISPTAEAREYKRSPKPRRSK